MAYGLLALFSTILGAIVGVGGGLIMRPALDFMGITKELASFSSAITVFFMGIVSLYTVKKKGAQIQLKKTAILAVGSMIGGFAGASLLELVNENIIGISYIFAMILVLVCVIWRDKLPAMEVTNPVLQLVLGGATGLLSGFFGIGGGPFQMTVLLLFFNLKAKDAAVQSICITLLTTISSLARYSMAGNADFSLAVYMIPMAIVGGYIGGIINRKFSDKQVTRLFNYTVAAIICLQIYTVFIK